MDKGDHKAAIDRWRKFLELVPDSAETARRAFEMVLEKDPDHAAAHYHLAMTLIGLGKSDEAVAHLERYLDLAPEGAQAATARQMLEQLQQ